MLNQTLRLVMDDVIVLYADQKNMHGSYGRSLGYRELGHLSLHGFSLMEFWINENNLFL